MKKIHIGGSQKDQLKEIDHQIIFGAFNVPSEVENEPEEEMINTVDLFSEAEESCMQIRSQI